MNVSAPMDSAVKLPLLRARMGRTSNGRPKNAYQIFSDEVHPGILEDVKNVRIGGKDAKKGALEERERALERERDGHGTIAEIINEWENVERQIRNSYSCGVLPERADGGLTGTTKAKNWKSVPQHKDHTDVIDAHLRSVLIHFLEEKFIHIFPKTTIHPQCWRSSTKLTPYVPSAPVEIEDEDDASVPFDPETEVAEEPEADDEPYFTVEINGKDVMVMKMDCEEGKERWVYEIVFQEDGSFSPGKNIGTWSGELNEKGKFVPKKPTVVVKKPTVVVGGKR